MHILFGALLMLAIPLAISIPYLLLETLRPFNPLFGLLVLWGMFGLGYIWGKKEQEHQDLERKKQQLREKELDEHDKSRGIGKYYKPEH